MLTGKYLVNLDSEDEGEISSAGGIDTVATFRYTMEEAPKNYAFFGSMSRTCRADIRATISTRAASIPTRPSHVCCGTACRATS